MQSIVSVRCIPGPVLVVVNVGEWALKGYHKHLLKVNVCIALQLKGAVVSVYIISNGYQTSILKFDSYRANGQEKQH